MKCYICDQTPPTSAMRYNVADAIGICHNCGVGVCAKHSRKGTNPDSPLLCAQCSDLRAETSVIETVNVSSRKKIPANA